MMGRRLLGMPTTFLVGRPTQSGAVYVRYRADPRADRHVDPLMNVDIDGPESFRIRARRAIDSDPKIAVRRRSLRTGGASDRRIDRSANRIVRGGDVRLAERRELYTPWACFAVVSTQSR